MTRRVKLKEYFLHSNPIANFILQFSIFSHATLWSASQKCPYSVFGALLASFRPSSNINCEWMQTPAEEYGLQEACHKLSPLGRTFNLLSWGTAPFQVVQLKDMHLPAFYSHTARRFKRRESIWSKRYYTDCRCGIFSTNYYSNSATGPA